jgi:biopolymer transport protein ExbB
MVISKRAARHLYLAVLGVTLFGVLLLTQSLAQEGVAPGEEAASAESLFSLLRKGGPVMIPLALASVIALAIIFERFISLRRNKIIPEGFISGLKEAFNPPEADVNKALDYCERGRSPVGHIFKAGLLNLKRGEEFVEKAIEDAGTREAEKLRRSLRGLSIIATVSPLLGLLGTVYGMIGAFQTATAVGLGKAELLAQGIYEALVTTATGLTIAIPVLLFFQYFLTRVDTLVDEIDEMGIEFMEHYVSRQKAGESS